MLLKFLFAASDICSGHASSYIVSPFSCRIGIQCSSSGVLTDTEDVCGQTSIYDQQNQKCVAENGAPAHLDTCIASTNVPDFCSSDPCENGATCTNDATYNTYECACTDDYHGENCDIGRYCQ